MFSRFTINDFYWPAFAHLSEQAVLNKEIFLSNSVNGIDDNPVNDEVFGYQERYAEMRYGVNRTSGYMRSSAQGSLDVWHLGDHYKTLPVLGSSWIQEDKSNVDRTLAVSSVNSPQFLMDCFIRAK